MEKSRINEIAYLAFIDKVRHEGMPLKPKEVVRGIKNSAKKAGIPEKELAEFAKVVITELYNETISELDKFTDSNKVKV